MKKWFASVLSVLLCCAFFAGCSSPEPDSPKISTLLNSADLIDMDGESLVADGFALQESEYSSTYSKTASTEFDEETHITVSPNVFVLFQWFFDNDLISPKYQMEELVDLYTKKFGTPECKYNGNTVSTNDTLIEEAFDGSENFTIDYYYSYEIEKTRYIISIGVYVYQSSSTYNRSYITTSIMFGGSV